MFRDDLKNATQSPTIEIETAVSSKVEFGGKGAFKFGEKNFLSWRENGENEF